MSARLVKKVSEASYKITPEQDRVVMVYTSSGREILGQLREVDIANGTIELLVTNKATSEQWRILIDIDHIEGMSPRWKEAA